THCLCCRRGLPPCSPRFPYTTLFRSLEFAGQELAFELLVFADVRRNHLPDLARAQQLAEAETIDAGVVGDRGEVPDPRIAQRGRSEEHTSELQSRENLVCRLLLEKQN